MEVRILRDTAIDCRAYRSGDTVHVNENGAQALVMTGTAEYPSLERTAFVRAEARSLGLVGNDGRRRAAVVPSDVGSSYGRGLAAYHDRLRVRLRLAEMEVI